MCLKLRAAWRREKCVRAKREGEEREGEILTSKLLLSHTHLHINIATMDSNNQPSLLPPMSPPSLDSSAFLGGLPLLGQDPSLDPLVASHGVSYSRSQLPAYSPMTSTTYGPDAYPDLPPLPSFESSSDYPADLSSLQLQLLQRPVATSTISKSSTTKKAKANVKVVARGKKTTATDKGTGTGKKRGPYNSYKDEAGQLRVKHAIETFLERRRQNSNESLRAFAAEVDIKYETLKPFCRADESKRKKFVVKGQTKLVPEVRSSY